MPYNFIIPWYSQDFFSLAKTAMIRRLSTFVFDVVEGKPGPKINIHYIDYI